MDSKSVWGCRYVTQLDLPLKPDDNSPSLISKIYAVYLKSKFALPLLVHAPPRHGKSCNPSADMFYQLLKFPQIAFSKFSPASRFIDS